MRHFGRLTAPWCLPGPPHWTPSLAVWDGDPPCGLSSGFSIMAWPHACPRLCLRVWPRAGGGRGIAPPKWCWTHRIGSATKPRQTPGAGAAGVLLVLTPAQGLRGTARGRFLPREAPGPAHGPVAAPALKTPRALGFQAPGEVRGACD